MGLFGPSPQEQASQAVEKAKVAQKKSAKYLKKENKELRRRLRAEREDVSTLTGLPPKETAQGFNENFYKTIAGIGAAYAGQLAKYDPNVLGTQSARRFAGAINASLQDYTNRLNAVSREGSARMYQALATPISQFQRIAQDPAFNNLIDTTYMEYVKNPPTVTSDVGSMQLYTYNV